MAIGTYAQLQTAVANWLERGDLTDRIPEFITLAEARINRRLRRSNLETDLALVGVPGSRFIALPATFDTALQMWLTDATGRNRLIPVPATQLETSTSAGRPSFYAIDGSNVAFERPLDQAYNFELRQTAMLALSDASPTNAILTQWPDLYLNGTLAEAAPYMLDDERMKIFEPKFVVALDEVGRHESRNSARSTLRVDLPGLQRRSRRFNIQSGL